MYINSFAKRYPIRPQPGKVNTHAKTISLTTEKFIADNLLVAPTPIIAVVFVCVVLTGIPKTEESKRHEAAAMSAEKPWYFSSLTISMPTDLIILYPPIDVPILITKEHKIIIHTGGVTPPVNVLPLDKNTLNIKTAINF